jgi:hypothetical protein
MGTTPRDCATPPRISIDVRNNQFSLEEPHPNVAGGAPTLRDSASAVYRATILIDGTFAGTSDRSSATLVGRISGTRMSGQINGLLCQYDFTADRA